MKPKTSVPVKAATKPEVAREVKRSVERSRGFAEGGSGPTRKTFGTGTRTVTARSDAANELLGVDGLSGRVRQQWLNEGSSRAMRAAWFHSSSNT
jgi:hypothetical protein